MNSPLLKDDVLVIVPAFNEQESIGAVLRTLLDNDYQVLVIDDGSVDKTRSIAQEAGVNVLTLPFNLGVGGALRAGFKFAVRNQYRAVVQVDADGQHDASSASALLVPVLDGSADLVVGSRFASGYKVSGARAFGMRYLSRVVSRRVGVEITDTTSGFRAFSANAIAIFAVSYPTEYLSDTVEALLDAHDAGLRIEERPVVMRSRMGGTASSGRLRSTYLFLRLLVVILFHPLRRRREQAAKS